MPAPADATDSGAGVALLVAAAMVPGTFARSLSARSAVDQGLVTGLSAGLHYLLTVASQDALRAIVESLDGGNAAEDSEAAKRRRLLTLVADLAMVPVSLAVARALPPRPGEAMSRGAVRQVAWRFAATGGGGALLVTAQAALRGADDRLGAGGRIAALPIAVPIGLGVALAVEHRRQIETDEQTDGPALATPSKVRALATAGAVVGGLSVAAYVEHLAASELASRLSSHLPGGQQFWRLAGHGIALGALGAAGLRAYGKAMRKVEAGATANVAVFEDDEATRWVEPTASGSPESLVPWADLGREGRRHALAMARPDGSLDRPEGSPDLSIETVMGVAAKATPVQVYVSLDSAPTVRERVDLALAEMERTGAFDRSLLMLVSPTGTGYVNYVGVAAAQYLTLGDVASVTMQYSKRPSPLSLTKVKDARAQNRLLWLSILERLRDRPGPRPRVVVFGESLGAHTSQDVFLHWGTLGPRALGIDKALWIGTPYISGWLHEVTAPDRLDVDHECVALVNDFGQLEDLGEERRAALRYVLVSHDNDGVTKFGPDLLATPPAWLGPDRPRHSKAAGASPRGIPAEMRWRPITTFFQTMIDMKNAQAPGAFRAFAHDYRADLVRFISEVYDLPADAETVANVETAVRARETYRENLLAQ